MIKEYLESFYNLGNLHSSWLIGCDDLDGTLQKLKSFISSSLLNLPISLENNPDFMLVERQVNSSNEQLKNISIEQIRSLQRFLYKTPAISNCKVAVILQSDLMNKNASNCCLKILEDTPDNSYMFLLTNRPNSMLVTIRSRCQKLNLYSEIELIDKETSEEFMNALLTDKNFSNKLTILNKLTEKNRDLWLGFSKNILMLLSKFTKKSVGIEVTLNEIEQQIFLQMKSTHPLYLQQKYEKIRRIIEDTINYDLDLRASCALIFNQFSS